MRTPLHAILIALAVVGTPVTGVASAVPKDEIRGAVRSFVEAQNAHDLNAVKRLLSDSPDFLWLAPGRVVRGRDAALDRFRELFQGAWRIEPDWPTFEVLRLDVSTIESFARVSISAGVPARMARMNLLLVRTAHGWRVLNIIVSDLPPA